MYRQIIFDFDGVLIDSNETGVKVIQKLATEFGYSPPTSTELRSTDSRTSVKKLGLGLFGLWRFLHQARREMTAHKTELRPFQMVPTLLSELAVRDIRLSIVSSNTKDNVKFVLQRHGLLEHFDDITAGGAYLGKHRKIKSAMRFKNSETLYIGDETRDIEACHKIGVPVAAAAWGYHNRELLIKYEPQFVLDQPLDLLRTIDSLN